MPKPEQSAEPSIEEILASIRRIIADDGAPAKGPGPRGYPKPAGDPYRGETDGRPAQHRTTQAYNALGEMPEPRGEDELLELTEDFLLEDAELAAPVSPVAHDLQPMPHGTPPAPAETRVMSASMAPASAFDVSAVDAGLQSVLSNVAAEVERLAAGDMAPMPAPSARLFGVAPAPVNDPVVEPRPRAAAPAPMPAPAQPESVPQPEARAAPTSAPVQQAAPRQRTHSRPVWSARRLEGGPAPRNEQPAAPELDAPEDALPQGFGGRDRWEEGVQMPVPESGPQIPFPYSPEPEARSAAAPGKQTAAAAAPAPTAGMDKPAPESGFADLDSEKSFVGDFLSRVFGGTHANMDEPLREEPAFDEPDLKGKAEKLAKATVSDFASDKLHAPSLADVLHADKPFMAQLTDSLESALAEVETLDELDGELGRDVPQAVASTAKAPLLPSDDMPEEPPLVEPEADLPFAAPELEAPAQHATFAAASQPMTPAPSQAGSLAVPKPPAQPPHVFHPDPIFEDRRAEAVSLMPAGIEDSIKEMIKPLIVQWLNANLSRIVEQAVREELGARRGEFSDLLIGGNPKL